MINGVLLLDKPKGISSNSAANIVKKCVGATKAGHLGTLDVEGRGLLPITLGKSTKLFDYFLNKDKVYQTTFKFGIETTTLDLEGEITRRDDKIIAVEDILRVIPKLIGKQSQMPPQYSAKKINGRKAYDIARSGEKANLSPKLIEIFDIKLLSQEGANEFTFLVHCSSGTYIRSLARDMAKELSTCAIMSDIIRTRCGSLHLEDAFSLDEIKQGKFEIIPPFKLFNLNKILLSDEESVKVLNGVFIRRQENDGEYLIFNKENFIGVGKIQTGVLKITLRLI